MESIFRVLRGEVTAYLHLSGHILTPQPPLPPFSPETGEKVGRIANPTRRIANPTHLACGQERGGVR